MEPSEFDREEMIKAFHMMWDNYPEMVRLIDRRFNVIAGNPVYYSIGGKDNIRCNTGDPALHRGCQAMNALKTHETRTHRSEVGGMIWEAYWVPVAGSDEYYVHFTNGFNEHAARSLPPLQAAR